MTENAEPQTFLKDGTSDWNILKLAWVGKGGQDYVFRSVFKGEWGLMAGIYHYSKYV